jgi:hypothetical protein
VIATGVARAGTAVITKSSVTNVAITAASAANPRRDIIYMDAAGTISVSDGTPEAIDPVDTSVKFQLLTPAPNEVPTDCIILCEVYVAKNATTLGATDLLDKRVIIRSSEALAANGVRNFYASDGTTLLMQLTEPEGNLYIKGKVLRL